MLDPPSSGTPFIILPGNSWHFMTRHILSMSFDVASPYVLKSHESFTYVSPDVFSVSHKSLIVNILQEIVRVSFSAPNASQKCGAFLFVAGMDNGFSALDMDASDVYTEEFFQG